MTRTVLRHRRPNETREVRLGDAVYSVCVGFDLAGEGAPEGPGARRRGFRRMTNSAQIRAILPRPLREAPPSMSSGETRAGASLRPIFISER